MSCRARMVAMVIASILATGCVAAPPATPAASPIATLTPNAIASPSPSHTVAPTTVATPSPTVDLRPAESPSPKTSSPSSAAAIPTGTALPHVDPDLEAFLPTTLAGTAPTRFSIPGSTFQGGSDMCILICGDEPYRYAKELDVDIDDVTIAFAVSDSLGLGMIAYRARGAVARDLIPARIAIGGYTGHAHLYDLPVTVGGRPATYLDAGMATSGEYLMTRHDVLFIVLGEAPSNGRCQPGSCASPPPGPWTAPAHVIEALGAVP